MGRMGINAEERTKDGSAKLRDIMEHDELYKAYPEIAETKVIATKMEEGHRGSYNPKRTRSAYPKISCTTRSS